MNQTENSVTPCKRNNDEYDNTCNLTQGRCKTCGRTKEDILKWKDMSPESQRKRINELKDEGYI